ncbi:unnamed protein product [Gongylonema pulchrum]|uniref:Uncharacterized protein n=1 Tax=Gongylonema pulchrum TaxID=637853 RepID=A0A183E6G4_9BILA|nr:unnamed protein product [Gongylonema pulchrum]
MCLTRLVHDTSGDVSAGLLTSHFGWRPFSSYCGLFRAPIRIGLTMRCIASAARNVILLGLNEKRKQVGGLIRPAI